MGLLRASFFAAISIWFLAVGANGYASAGKAVSLEGSILKQPKVGNAHEMAVGEDLDVGDVVRTGEKSNAKLLLVDQSIIDLGPLSVFRVDAMTGGEEPSRQIDLGVDDGRVRASISKKVNQQGRFKIRTRACAMAVRGTEFAATVEKGSRAENGAQRFATRVTVFDGNVLAEGTNQESVLLSPGKQAELLADYRGEEVLKAAGKAIRATTLTPLQLQLAQKMARVQDATFRQAVVVGATGTRLRGESTLAFASGSAAPERLSIPASEFPTPGVVIPNIALPFVQQIFYPVSVSVKY